MAIIYNSFAVGDGFWRYFYFITRDLSISLLVLNSARDIKNITLQGVALFTSFYFLSNVIGEGYMTVFYIGLVTTIFFIAYGIVFRSIFVNHIKSDEYNDEDNYIVIRSPKRLGELLRAYILLDSLGSVKIVNKGIQTGFKVKKHNVGALITRHTYNPEYYTYIKTDKDIEMVNKNYHLLFNNCLNCWNINIKKEIKWRQNW